MVKEYIEEQVAATGEKLEEKQRELKKILDVKQIVCDKIRTIQKESDINFEIFSPRSGKISTRDQVRKLEKEQNKIELEIKRVKEEVALLEDKNINFQLMILEIEEMEEAVQNR